MTAEAPDDRARPHRGDFRLDDGLAEVAVALVAAGFAALWVGRARRPEDLVPCHADTVSEVARLLAGRGRCELDDDGTLVGAHGLTLHGTRHRFVHDGIPHSTWCAFDAIGIPAGLGLDAVAQTDCRSCRRSLEVSIAGGAPENLTGPVLWLPASTDGHLISVFCAHADLYCSTAHLERRVDVAAAPGEVVNLAAAAALGRENWRGVADIIIG